MVVVGPSNSGKTTHVRRILQQRERMIDPGVDHVIMYYDEYQHLYGKMLKEGSLTKIIQGWPSYEEWRDEVIQYKKSGGCITVFDDSYEASQLLAQIYSIGSHHLKARCVNVFTLARALHVRAMEKFASKRITTL